MKRLNLHKNRLGTIALLVLSFLFSQAAFAQTTVKGKVVDSANGQPLVGVVVMESGTNNAVTSQSDGSYSIKLKDARQALIFSILGYADKSIEINNRSVVDVSMESSSENIDEVVVVGYGSQRKLSLTGAVDNISSKDIENRSVPNALGVLQGKLPGVTVIKKSSQPGSPDITIRIRGEGTLGNNEPLILIDGVPGDVNLMNPEDIESVTVLKDAATTAIYGVRASGGVMLITTKSGKRNQPLKVGISALYGIQTATRTPEFVGAQDYMILRNEALSNVGGQTVFTAEDIRDAGTSESKYANTNWVKEIYKPFAVTQNYNINVQGGGDRTTYFFSYGYLDQDGIAISDKYNQTKNNIRSNITADVIKNIVTLEGNIAYDKGINTTPATGNNAIYSALKLAPIAPIRNKFGNYVPSTGGSNPIAEINESGISSYDWNNVVVTGTARINIARGVTAKGIYSAMRSTGIGKSFIKKYPLYDNDNVHISDNRKDAYLGQHATQNMSNDLTLQADFNRTFGQHTVTAVAGMAQNEGHWQQFTASKERFATNQLEILNAGEYNPLVGGTENHYALRSWFSRIGESYKNKYYVEALLRQDLTSRFAPENRRGTFYAFSGSWRLTEENFMELLKGKILNELKLRGSYGTVGNQNVGGSLYPTYSEMGKFTSTFSLGNEETSAYAQSILPNRNIHWEVSRMTNFGLDLSMFNNRLTFTGDIWKRMTKDIIRQPVLPAVVGLGQASVNLGSVSSRGWELSLGWAESRGDWSYSFKADLSDATNKVVSLGGTNPVYSDALIDVGYPMNSLYGYRVSRIAQESDFTYNVLTGKFTPKPGIFLSSTDGSGAPGDLIFIDLDKNGVFDSADREVIGNMQPRYTFSFTANAAWKNFDVSIFLQGVGKCDGYIYSEAIHAFTTDYAQPQKIHLDRWTKNNTTATYPRLTYNKSYNQSYFSDFWLQDASYLRIKNVALGYTLPEAFTKKAGISKCRFYISAENLFTFTNYFYAFDPETILNNGSFYPQLRVVYLGANITF